MCWRRGWVLKRITSCGTSVARIWPPSRRGSLDAPAVPARAAAPTCASACPWASSLGRSAPRDWDWRRGDPESSAPSDTGGLPPWSAGWHRAAGHSVDTGPAYPRYAAPPACEHTTGSAARAASRHNGMGSSRGESAGGRAPRVPPPGCQPHGSRPAGAAARLADDEPMLPAIQIPLSLQPPHIEAPEHVEGHALVPPLPLARAITTHIVPLRVFFVEIIKKLFPRSPRRGSNASNDAGKGPYTLINFDAFSGSHPCAAMPCVC